MPLPKGYSWTAKSMQVVPSPTREDINTDKQNFSQSFQQDWTWDNDKKLGPQGEQLPTNAIGWQPNGQAYYGEGLKGWWSKVSGKITDAYNYGREEGLRVSNLSKTAIEQKNRAGQLLTGASTYETTKKTEEEITAKETKTKEFSEKVGETETGAQILGVAEAAKETLNQAIWTVLDGFGAVSVKTEQVLGTAGYTVADIASGQGVSAEQFQKNWNASRMAYSAIFDASIYDEMTRRVESGMNVEFAAQEVMNQKKWTMWPETIGQMLLDPLNYVSVLTKAGDAVLLRKTVQSDFHKIINPAVQEVLQNAGKMDETRALKYTEDVITVQQALPAVYSHADEIAKADRALVKGSQAYKMGSLTSSGKMARLANHTSEIFMHIANNSDDAAEVILGMIKSTSSNKAEAAEGLASMMNFVDSPALFSQAGNDTTAMLSRMYNKYGDKWLETIEGFAKNGDTKGLMSEMFNRLDEVGKELYPSVSDMLKAEDAIAAGGQITADTQRLADAAKNLPSHVRFATRAHEAAQKVVGPINKGFASMYMGWSPGFAFRNLSNNTVQVAIDQGFKALWGSADNMISKAEKFHGGDIMGQFGIGSKGVIDEVAKTANKTDVISATKKVLKESKLFGKDAVGPGQLLGEVAEINAAKRILATAYMREFRNGSKAMFKAIAPELKAAGVSDDIVKKLPTLLEKHGGNLDEMMTSLRSSLDSGTIDMFEDVSRIDPEYQKSLQQLNVWDDYVDRVLGATSKEEAAKAADEIFENLAKQADMVYSDGRMVTSEYDTFVRALEDGKKGANSAARGMIIENRIAENDRAIKAAFSIIEEAEKLEAQMRLGVSVKPKGFFNTTVGNWGADAAKMRDALLDRVVQGKNALKKVRTPDEMAKFWNDHPEFLQGPMPEAMTWDELADRFWSGYFDQSSDIWSGARNDAISHVTTYLDNLEQAGAKVPIEWRETIKEATERAQDFDTALVGENGKIMRGQERLPYGTRTSQIAQIANKYGVATATEKFVATDRATLNIINKHAGVEYRSLEEVPLEVAERAFAKKTGRVVSDVKRKIFSGSQDTLNAWMDANNIPDNAQEKIFSDAENILSGISDKDYKALGVENDYRALSIAKENYFLQNGHFDDAGKYIDPNAEKYIMPHPDDAELTQARAIHDQMDKIGEMGKWIKDDIAKNFGRKQVVDKVSEKTLRTVEGQLKQKLAEIRLYSSRAAQEARKFTLLDYGEKTYSDIAKAYLFPYHYWYKGTYRNWMKRIVTNPDALAHYDRYKQNLANIHAGMPEWWKNNLNTNELFGLDSDNPLYLNIEATLWPLNGITGTDFNDPNRRVDWWTTTLDYSNKFGPSLWTPINMLTGAMLLAKGEKDAGDRWLGRLIPQTSTIKAGASMLGASNFELDPIVRFLQGGLDPYEERRAQRALAMMEQEAMRGELPYTQEQIQDAAYNKQGEIWDEAVRRAIRGRAPSQLSSFFLGVGFKGRTKEDMEIDKFYTDYNKLWALSAGKNITPEEFKDGMSQLKDKYPFMDTVLLARRDSDARDAGLAYLVMSRIPPGQSSDFAKAAGLTPDLMEKFYNTRGQLDEWSASDRARFMSGILTMNAVLETPSDMTRKEWESAKKAYSQMNTEAKTRYGENILDVIDGYYQAKTDGKGDDYLETHPEVQEFMDWKAQRIMGSPLLSAYYGGAEQISGYYRSQMYADIEKQLGKEIFDVMDEYNDIKTYGTTQEYRSFYNQNKAKIKQYYAIRDDWYLKIDQETAKLASQISEGQGVQIREDYDVTSPTQQEFVEGIQQESVNIQDLQSAMPTQLVNLVNDYFYNGQNLPESAEKQLDRIAKDLGYENRYQLIQQYGIALYAGAQ